MLFLLPTTRLDVINVILLYRLLQVTQRCSPVGLVKVFIHKVRHLQVLGFSRNGIAQGPKTRRERGSGTLFIFGNITLSTGFTDIIITITSPEGRCRYQLLIHATFIISLAKYKCNVIIITIT